jgi:hypothetical protein
MSSAAVGFGVPMDIVITQFARHCFLIFGAGFTASAVAVIAGLDEIDADALRTWMPQSWRLLHHVPLQEGRSASLPLDDEATMTGAVWEPPTSMLNWSARQPAMHGVLRLAMPFDDEAVQRVDLHIAKAEGRVFGEIER